MPPKTVKKRQGALTKRSYSKARSSPNWENRPRNRGQRRSATGSITGSARRDAIYTLPLLGTKFEDKRMLYYDYELSLAGTSGILTVSYFRTNDVYDPWQTGSGHQPIGFDQAMLFWEQFAVFSSKISVTFVSDTAIPVRVGVYLSPDTNNPTANEVIENGYVKSSVISGIQTGTSKNITTIDLTCDNMKYYQMSSKETYFANPNFVGTVASSPVEGAYFGVFAFSMATANTFQVYYDVTISYDVRFQEPRKISHSLVQKMIIERDANADVKGEPDSELLRDVVNLTVGESSRKEPSQPAHRLEDTSVACTPLPSVPGPRGFFSWRSPDLTDLK